jgi:NitT/TauT family transport system permease protein
VSALSDRAQKALPAGLRSRAVAAGPSWQRRLLTGFLRSPLASMIALALLWEFATIAFAVPRRTLPPPSAVFADAWTVRADLLASFGRTLLETLLGFIAGSLLGCLSGITFAYVRTLERSVFPLFVISQSMPVVAFGALVVIWFGNTLLAKVVMALFLSFLPVTVNTLRGLKGVDPQRIGLMRSFGARGFTLFAKLAWPWALPQVMVGLKVAISLSLIGSIVGEWFGETIGLGVMLLQAMYTEDMTRLWTVIVACGLMGSALYGLISLIERRLVWWRSAS